MCVTDVVRTSKSGLIDAYACAGWVPGRWVPKFLILSDINLA